MKKLLVLFVVFCVTSILESVEEDLDVNDIPELRYLNKSVDPCDDFYEYTCGNFKNIYPLSEGTLTIDHFTLLENRLLDLAISILSSEDLENDALSLKKARSAYKACADVSYVDTLLNPELTIVEEENGFPLVQLPDLIGPTKFGWNEIGNAVSKYGIPMIFSVEAYSDLADPTKNLIRLFSDPMSNPTLLRTKAEVTYEEVIEKGFLDMGAGGKARSALAPFDIFLRSIAFKIRAALGTPISEDKVIENIDTMANFMKGVYQGGYVPDNVTIENFSDISVTLGQLNEWTKKHFNDSIEIDWVDYMSRVLANAAVHVDENTEVLAPTGLARLLYGILNWVNMNTPETVKNFALLRIFLYLAPDSDAETRAAFETYYRGINLPIVPRQQYCTRKIIDSVGTAALSFAVAYEYQHRYFNVNQFSKALEMIRDLQLTFKEVIGEITWMDDNSKAVAIEKVNNIVTLLGYPDFVANKTNLDEFYENVRICKWDNYGNSRRIRAFKQAYQISQVAKRDRTFWDKSPFEVNAYYNRPNNRIIFPVAVLNPVFFGSNSSILDYGRIGSVIGHEITHGFDAQGQMYDQNGIMRQWWSAETRDAFTSRTQCFIEQYSKYYIPELDAYINSTVTLNENIADNGGARESYRAMKKLLVRSGAQPRLKGFTTEQLFFLGFGTMWCNNPSKEYLLSAKDGVHATSKWRVNGVLSNMEEFSEAFNCKAGSKMNPTNKCRLW